MYVPWYGPSAVLLFFSRNPPAAQNPFCILPGVPWKAVKSRKRLVGPHTESNMIEVATIWSRRNHPPPRQSNGHDNISHPLPQLRVPPKQNKRNPITFLNLDTLSPTTHPLSPNPLTTSLNPKPKYSRSNRYKLPASPQLKAPNHSLPFPLVPLPKRTARKNRLDHKTAAAMLPPQCLDRLYAPPFSFPFPFLIPPSHCIFRACLL